MPSAAIERKEQVQAQSLQCLQDLLPGDVIGTHALSEICIPEWAFRPDHWSTTFLRGLMQVGESLSCARVWEVGVGTGVNLIALSDVVADAVWYYSDFNPDCTLLAQANLLLAGVSGSYTPLHGKRNLVHAGVGQPVPKVDVVFGCLPQVPVTHGINTCDRVAHYYNPDMYPFSRRHTCGLGLNEALLMGARKVLFKHGRAILNLSGRAGKERLEEMFDECGYTSRVLYETIVPQHAATSLSSLACIESEDKAGYEFEFFADPEAHTRLSAGQAEARRCSGLAVYHKIFVMEGTLDH